MDSGQRDLNSEHTTPDRQTSKQVGTKRNARERERDLTKNKMLCVRVSVTFLC